MLLKQLSEPSDRKRSITRSKSVKKPTKCSLALVDDGLWCSLRNRQHKAPREEQCKSPPHHM